MSKFKVDFGGLEDKATEVVTGRFTTKIEKIELKEGTKARYLEWSLLFVDGKNKGLHVRHITSLSPNALFNLRDTLEALGVKVPKAAVAIDPDKFIGKYLGVEIVMREYEGKEYPNVKKVFPAAEVATVAPTDEPEDELPFDFGGGEPPKSAEKKSTSDAELSIDLD